ncbi:MAG: helix-turn-helix domain-containing protein [Lachnospiraceae bacterium]|nr:helix-turn-helix domain-containing protein [Lachnospiraceae bacterium]
MDQIYKDIGDRISLLRHDKNMTQEEFAELLDVTVKHISAVESGRSSFSVPKLVHICDVLDCSLDYLVRGKNIVDSSIYLPESIIEILQNENQQEASLLLEYMNLFCKMRDFHQPSSKQGTERE